MRARANLMPPSTWRANLSRARIRSAWQMKEALKERYKMWKRSVKSKAQQASLDFNRFLSTREMAGELKFNHEADTLDTEVCINCNDANSRATQSVKTLSGGEQSFTALNTALSMWSFADSPLRAMDEHDKFMDDKVHLHSNLPPLDSHDCLAYSYPCLTVSLLGGSCARRASGSSSTSLLCARRASSSSLRKPADWNP